MSAKAIIKLSRTSDDQLMELANKLNVQVDQIDYKQNMNRNADYAILNLGTPQISGTHWICVSNKDKVYFDSLGLPRPRLIPEDYYYREVMIQNPHFGYCGQFCVLFLYYLQHGKIDDFYKLFKKYTTGSLLGDDDTKIFSKPK